MMHVRKVVLLLILVLLCTAACGCNTAEGVGEDLERAGEAIQDVFR